MTIYVLVIFGLTTLKYPYEYQFPFTIWLNFFYLVHNDNFFQILLHLHENRLTYQMEGADFKYEVENSS